jgi:3-oxoacyl-[acyl-carrier protein] reductase
MTDTPQRFAGRTVMVTGAGTGYGAEIAVRAAQEGASTVVLIQGDIVSWEDIKRMASTVDAELGSLDALINNVGDMASEQESWRDITEELIDHTLAVDIKGTMLMTHEFGTRMLERQRGAIVNIGSTVIVRGSPRAPQYAAGKYGVVGLTKSYAKAFAPHVRVNTFAPGFMKTERVLNRADWKAGRGEQLARDTPAGRIPEPAELAGTALFLASDEAAHITGSYMICDGGYSMLGA